MNKRTLQILVLGFSLGWGLSLGGKSPAIQPNPNPGEIVAQKKTSKFQLEVIKQYQGHKLTGEALIHLHYSRDGKYLLSGATDGLAKIWTANGELVREFAGKPVAMIFNCGFSFDGSQIITAGYDGVARIWDIEGNVIRELKGHRSAVTGALFLSGNKGVVTASDDGTTKIWSASGEQKFTITRPGVTRNMDISFDGKTIATTQDLGTITLFNPEGNDVKEIKTGQGRLNDVQFSPDGKMVASAGFDGTARVFTLDGKEIVKLKVLEKGWVTGVAFSKEGLIATVSDDGILRLWDLQGTLLDSYNPELERLGHVAFHPDGKHLAIAAYHGTVILLKVN